MTRQSLSQLRVSPLRLQQGLFASLALMVTLIAGQQLQQWQQSPQQSPVVRPSGNDPRPISVPLAPVAPM